MAIAQSEERRPFSDGYLLAYSDEHVFYEFDMFLWSARLLISRSTRVGRTSADVRNLKNMLIEIFVLHMRNLIDFLYLDYLVERDHRKLRRTDVIAADFFDAGTWQKLRPPLSTSLDKARSRANTELAHLTSHRIAGTPPKKGWDFPGLTSEILPLLGSVATKASPTRLSAEVSAALDENFCKSGVAQSAAFSGPPVRIEVSAGGAGIGR